MSSRESRRRRISSVAFDEALPGLGQRVTVTVHQVPARLALSRALDGTSLQALVSPTGQIVLVARPAKPVRSTRIGGTIRDAETGQALDGARVELIGTRFTTYSRDSGSFALGQIPSGAYDAPRSAAWAMSRWSRRSCALRVTTHHPPLELSLRRATLSLSEIIVTPGYFGLLQSSLAAPQSLSREQLETIPQIGEDIYRAVSRLPGVSADDFSAKFSVRGGSGDELYVSLDGLELVEPFHLKDIGGAFSIIDIQSLGSAALTTGGFSAEYGDRLTGVFTLKTADPRTDGVHTSVRRERDERARHVAGRLRGREGRMARVGATGLSGSRAQAHGHPRLHQATLLRPVRQGAVRSRPRWSSSPCTRCTRTTASGTCSRDEPNIFSKYRSSYGWLTWDAKIGSRLRAQSVASVGALALAARWRAVRRERRGDAHP